MALYWPDQKVALDIVDDPHRRPFEGDDSYTVVRVTCSELQDYESFLEISRTLCDLLGQEMPSSPEWYQRNQELHSLLCECGLGEFHDSMMPPFDMSYDELCDAREIQILAGSDDEAEAMCDVARQRGQAVRGVVLWDGPIPPGSFEDIGPFTRMSTPEYFFLRKVNELPLVEAVQLGVELCGKYRTSITQYTKGDEFDVIKSPRTTRARIRKYLRGARGTKEGKRAKRVLRLVSDDCSSPMGCYLYLLLCLPSAQGSYGFDRAVLSGAYATENGFVPSAEGKYLAYDLSWPDKLTALQYTGKKPPKDRQYSALCTEGMHTVCITDADIANPDSFDIVARRLAELAGFSVPEPTDKWLAARDRLRSRIPMPTFKGMRLTADEMMEHLAS